MRERGKTADASGGCNSIRERAEIRLTGERSRAYLYGIQLWDHGEFDVFDCTVGIARSDGLTGIIKKCRLRREEFQSYLTTSMKTSATEISG